MECDSIQILILKEVSIFSPAVFISLQSFYAWDLIDNHSPWIQLQKISEDQYRHDLSKVEAEIGLLTE